MQINLITSKTVIGALILVVGKLLEIPEAANYSGELHALSIILEGVGALVAAIGLRHAVAKAAKGVAQLHPATLVASLIGAFGLFGPLVERELPSPPLTLARDEWYPNFQGDSLKYVIMWKQPIDTVLKGLVDSTVFVLRSSKPGAWFTGTILLANTNTRRVKTTLADSFKLAKPVLGDSATFQITGFVQCRKGDCSVPGTAGWKYRETYAPPPATPTIRIETF